MKKKLLLTLLAVILSILPTYVNAETSFIDGINYYFDSTNKTATVTYNTDGEYSGTIIIPQSIQYSGATYNVTTIGYRAFYGCTGITSVDIPNSVTSIGEYAFNGCRGLTSITIPNNVTSIEDYAFSGCRGLTSITIPNNVTSIGDYAFSSCTGISSVNIPNSVTSIGDDAFSYCESLTSVTVPNSVTSIGIGAFCRCSGLTSVIIGNSVKEIGASAFSYCNNLTSVTIPNSVIEIGENAFDGCNNLTSVTIPNSVIEIGNKAFENTPFYNNLSDGVVYLGKVLYKYKGTMPTNQSNNITIQNGTTSISGGAFDGCSGLTSVTIPNSVTSIGPHAFSSCSGLTSVTIPNSVTSIGQSAFYYCSGLTSVTIPNSVTSIGQSAFYYCSGLTSVTIPNSVTSIGNNAFGGCFSLTSVTIGNSVKEIGNMAFENTPFYNNLSDGVVYFGKVLYKYKGTMPANTSITIRNGTTSISGGAFADCSGLTSVTIPNSVTSIGDYAFNGCYGLTSITIPNSVTTINYQTFAFSGLTSISIPNSVTSISPDAFRNCYNLTSVTIPSSVTTIGGYAFANTMVTSIVIPSSVTSIGGSAFTGLIKAKVEGAIPPKIANYGTFGVNGTLYVPKGSKSFYGNDNWRFLELKEYPDADVNQDSETDVVDVVDIARFVVGTASETFEEFLADLNSDRTINVADAIVLVNEIAGDTQFAKPTFAARKAFNDVLSLNGNSSSLSLQMEGTGEYAAFQFDLWLPSDMNMMQVSLNDARCQGHQLLYNKIEDGHYRVVVLSTSGDVFNVTSGELLSMKLDSFATGDVRIDNIHFVTASGIDVPFEAIGLSYMNDGVTTEIHSVDSNSTIIQPVYNLNGQRLTSPRKGLNIIGGKKIVVK